MYEPTEGATLITQLADERLKVASLEQQLAELEKRFGWATTASDEYGRKIDQVRKHIQDSIDNEEWEDYELDEPFWETLVELLDIEISKTVEIRIKAEWTANVKMPRNMEISDIAENLTIDEPESDTSSIELENVYERDVTILEA